jgi:putative ABC transport system permease protein
MDTLRQDIRYAIRRLVKSPGFTAVAVLTLALGIGANTAIFSVVNGVLLKPLPFTQPDRLVGLFHVSEGRRSTMSGPNFWDLRRESQTLADAAAFSRARMILTGQGEPVRLDGADVTGSFFDLLGARPLWGRTFREDDNQPGKPKIVVLSYGLWQQRFGGRPDVVGRRITLDGVETEVVGVMPAGFAYPAGRVIWTPIQYTKDFTTDQRGAWYLTAIGRARPGVAIEQVSAEVQTIGSRLAAKYPDMNEGVGLSAVPLLEAMVGDIRRAVLVLLGAVGFVLLIACVNVANLLLARAAARESEMAVRTALGAGRGRLVRQLLTESVMLGLLGAGFGLLLAVWGVEILIGMQPQGIPRLDDVSIDRTVMLFALLLAVFTGLVFGLVPAVQSTRGAVAGTIKESGRGALTSRSGSRVRSALVIAEMALAVMLLAGAGLLIRSFTKLASVDPGFRVEQALTFEVSLPDLRYEKEPQQVMFFDQLLPRLSSIPGVRSAGGVLSLPLNGSSFVLTFEVAGRPPVPPAQQPAMQVRVATPEYFSTIGIPLRRGRMFTEQDRVGTPAVVLITEAAAKQYFPNEEPLGKKITLGWGHGPGTPRAGGEVVGIIGDIKDDGLNEADPPQIYLPYRQWPVQAMAVVLKTSVPPASVADTVRREVYAVDPLLPVANVRTLEQVVARSISQPRFYTTLLGIFAAVALTLAAIGIFGVLSYAVVQRTREIGIRMALGARAASVVGLVVWHAMSLAAAGVALGSLLAWILSTSMMSGLLFSTDPRDLMTFSAVAVTLTVVALLAAYVPARRATRVDPIVALRAE